jgi:hypothetical protein
LKTQSVYSPLRVVHYVFNSDHYIGIVIANTTLLYKYFVFILKADESGE